MGCADFLGGRGCTENKNDVWLVFCFGGRSYFFDNTANGVHWSIGGMQQTKSEERRGDDELLYEQDTCFC